MSDEEHRLENEIREVDQRLAQAAEKVELANKARTLIKRAVIRAALQMEERGHKP